MAKIDLMTIAELLAQSTLELSDISTSARLDCEILLAHVLGKNKTFLFTYPQYQLSAAEQNSFRQLIQERQTGKPIAYIIGKQAFWNFELMVTPLVLIPRPETECLVEKALEYVPADCDCHVADLGTGSGAIALALALERPNWQITAVDISEDALNIARVNAEKLGVTNIEFQQGRWCETLKRNDYDMIVANPPYIADADEELEIGVRQFEPISALISGETGLEDLQEIIQTAVNCLRERGYLLLEHGHRQSTAVQQLLHQSGYQNIHSYQDYSHKPRIIAAQSI